MSVKTNKGISPLIHRPANAYSPVSHDNMVTVDFYYEKVYCEICDTKRKELKSIDGIEYFVHGTCEICGFHGEFDEWGEEIHCPKCLWSQPT